MLNKLLGLKGRREAKEPSQPVGSPPDGTRLYVVGDIHGHLSHLNELHELICDDAYRARAPRNVIVYLGDYVDRGLDSRGVIDLLINKPLDGFEPIHLLGNHESVMLDFIKGEPSAHGWLDFGGDTTLTSYGVRLGSDIKTNTTKAMLRAQMDLAAAVPDNHRQFLQRLRPYHVEGDFLMVHAGIRPGVPIEAQSTDDLIWIRDPFLRSNQPFGKIVIHGHTISFNPDVKPNRIGIDTGAYKFGVLSSVVLQDGHFRFLQTKPRLEQ